MSGKAQMISPDAYPQMLSPSDAARFSKTLRSADTAAGADRVLRQAAAPLQGAILEYVAVLEDVGHDLARLSETAHEIKGFADTAGLPAAARIAESLCRYMEQSEMAGILPDRAVVALHASAIARAARAPDLDAQLGETVARELATLAARKLAEAVKAG
jgi:hypothetical protein